jgi:hypothetical protein
MAITFPQSPGRAHLKGTAFVVLLRLSHFVSGYQDGRSRRIGLQRVFAKALRDRLHSNQAPDESDEGPSVVAPLPNDTISDEYWADVNSAIDRVGSQTRSPTSLNDPVPTASPGPFQQVMRASVHNPIAPPAAQEDYSYVTPQPLSRANAQTDQQVRSMGVVPYDMALGAHIMYGLAERNTETPPPTQGYVNEAFVAQCPMLMMQDAVLVTAPHCDSTKGSWQDPLSGRNLVHWNPNSGGLIFGVDSSINGAGAASFATLRERFTVARHVFSLENCMSVTRYILEENTIKVNHMAQGAISTMFEHDASVSEEAIFYQYVVKHPNGTAAAQSNMYRMDASQVNFSLVDSQGLPGPTITSANRVGHWTRNEWRTCDGNTRAWTVSFPAENQLFDTVATVQDLRVATAAAVTLMAYRDEEVGTDGFRHRGQGYMYWMLLRTMIGIFVAVLLVGICGYICLHRGYEKKLKKFFFRLEAALLPRSAAKERLPVIGATY